MAFIMAGRVLSTAKTRVLVRGIPPQGWRSPQRRRRHRGLRQRSGFQVAAQKSCPFRRLCALLCGSEGGESVNLEQSWGGGGIEKSAARNFPAEEWVTVDKWMQARGVSPECWKPAEQATPNFGARTQPD